MARKSKYRKEYCGKVIQLMQDGKSIAQVARELGVSVSTIGNWEKNPEFPEFQEAMSYARDYAKAWWEELGRNIAAGEIKANPTAWIYNMKCRFGGEWNENNKVLEALASGNEQQIDEQLSSLMKMLFKNENRPKSNKRGGGSSDASLRGKTGIAPIVGEKA